MRSRPIALLLLFLWLGQTTIDSWPLEKIRRGKLYNIHKSTRLKTIQKPAETVIAIGRVRFSLNGVYVNGGRIENAELHGGDEVSVVCGSGGLCGIGFVVERVVVVEEAVDRSLFSFRVNGVASGYVTGGLECGGVAGKADLMLKRCREILSSDDPILYIREHVSSFRDMRAKYVSRNRVSCNTSLVRSDAAKFLVNSAPALEYSALARGETRKGEGSTTGVNLEADMAGEGRLLSSVMFHREAVVASEEDPDRECCYMNIEHNARRSSVKVIADDGPHTLSFERGIARSDKIVEDKNRGACVPAPGKKFYLNRLHFMGHSYSEQENVISLPELLYPVEGLLRIFIATFTSDILWFVSYCEIPANLPVTIACHNAVKCWSSCPDERFSVPYSDFPNLVVVHPPFPEVIAFGKDRKKLGIACHHPKLLVLQREDSVRIIITSANLVPNQWLGVTNTVWWQDFPRASAPDYFSLFSQSSYGERNLDTQSDFAAQLAGFMASLLADVPSQAYWILELTKYDFKGAVGHLVASVPGIHSLKAPCISESMHFLTGNQCVPSFSVLKLVGSVEASVVGLSHLFRTSADSNGLQLKKLAAFLGKCHENAHGMSEVILKRNTNIAADVNAISVLIPNPEESRSGDFVQLGFLPRAVAKWVAPLSDLGFFSFSAYIYRKEVLTSALEGSNNKVQLILYGPTFADMAGQIRTAHAVAICSLIAAVQRCAGLWRLQEVLGHQKWPEYCETDFVFGSSSIGSVNAQFLAAFSAATGKRSLQHSESEESDPDWGCWSASQELRNPSIKILFPTIERVKSAYSGILASKYILCFSQKTWLRLRNVGILHDAVPFPVDRVGHPSHVKVARRRFQSKADSSSFGWVYCGSHNFSAAAWGRPLSNSLGIKSCRVVRNNPVLGSRLHILNYELGIIFIVPPLDTKVCTNQKGGNLDEIVLPFTVPAPKYRPRDGPATKQAMREALAELVVRDRARYAEATSVGDLMEEEIPDEEEEGFEVADCITVEKEDDKAYAETLWSQVDSSESC
ncbi:hypothetical protein RJ640_021426 [Escallonia rubra]|uniref:HIRAN domain-containing protein n=1 Tax=Escallonia rubra TaxID=112253 RepID=A0AA88QT19_9ASTE|nr:hypothetical protein RJ640_021426 [Escallonia rubra]